MSSAQDPYHQILIFLHGQNNSQSVDFIQPHIKHSLRYVYPLFMFLHAATCIIGLVGNIKIIITIGKRGLYKDQTFFFIGNLAFSDIFKCLFVLPITLTNLLIQPWIFGSFMCFFLPMLQCFPIHASMLTYLMIAIDRYRFIVTPIKGRASAGLCVIGVWVASVCIVLPYAVYIKYIDLGAVLGNKFDGVGICYYKQERHIEEYIRAMFVTLYTMPLAVIVFLCVKISAEIKFMESVPLSVHYTKPKETCGESDGTYNTKIRWAEETDTTSTKIDNEASSADSRSIARKDYNERSDSSEDDLDLAKEKTTQNYLITMVTLFAISWLPMNILILITNIVSENGSNTEHFDITYITFTWFGFLSTCANPVLFAFWCMSESTKDRLRGYFRFSNRSRSNASYV